MDNLSEKESSYHRRTGLHGVHHSILAATTEPLRIYTEAGHGTGVLGLRATRGRIPESAPSQARTSASRIVLPASRAVLRLVLRDLFTLGPDIL